MPTLRGERRLDTWYATLLWLIARKSGGEYRLPGLDIDDAPESCMVTTEYDRTTHELRIIALSGQAEAVVINRPQQWARSVQEPNSTPSSAASRPPERQPSAVLDDAAMAGIEQRLMDRAAERKRQRDQAELARVQRGE